MPPTIKNFKDKKLVEYLEPGMRVLVQFNWHGIGDQIMWQPSWQRLKQLHPEVEWHLEPNRDQQYFAETPEAPVDIIFNIAFKETATKRAYAEPLSKAERCCREELGIPFDKDLDFTWCPNYVYDQPAIKDNCIGVSWQVQSNPSRGMPWGVAQKIWAHIKKRGFTPIEVTFNNPNANRKNGRPSFVDYTCRDFKATEMNMFSVVSQCKGFIGVNTGTFCAATCIHSGHVLHVYTGAVHFSPWYKRFDPVPDLDVSTGSIDFKKVDDYLESCRG